MQTVALTSLAEFAIKKTVISGKINLRRELNGTFTILPVTKNTD